MSTQMHIRRYFGSIDAKGDGDGSRTSLLGRRVVFPANAVVCGPYIFVAISMSCDRAGQSRMTLLSTAHLYCLVEGNDRMASSFRALLAFDTSRGVNSDLLSLTVLANSTCLSQCEFLDQSVSE